MRNRLFICFLLACLLLYLGLPYLSIHTTSLEGIFSLVWLGFALMVLAGNLVGILYTPKRTQKGRGKSHQQIKQKRLRGHP